MHFSNPLSQIKKLFKRSPKTVDNPWTGKRVNVQPSASQSETDIESFPFFMKTTLASVGYKLRSIKLPNPYRPKMFRKAMRLITAGLVFIYSIVFAFSFNSPLSVLFLLTDLVLFYLLWLSRR